MNKVRVFDKLTNLLGAPIENISQSFYDSFVEQNVKFRAKAGLKETIIRRQIGKCCDWCAGLAGIYDVSDAPDDIYRRHENCRCMVTHKSEKGGYTDAWSKKEYETQQKARIAREKEITDTKEKNSEMLRRKIGKIGQEIIDKPTYNRLTKSFVKNGGIIIRGEDAEKWLEGRGYASYISGGNIAFIKDDATISDVLEEMYHAMQDRKNYFSEFPMEEMLLKREIQAQNYLISVKKKYKIPDEEVEVTKENLKFYQKKLKEYLKNEL